MTFASLVGIMTFAAGVPCIAGVLVLFPRWRRLFIGLMVFSTCHIKKPFYQEVFYVFYRGVDRGYGVTIPDLFFFGFALYLLIARPYKLKWAPHALPVWWMIIAVSVASLANAGDVQLGLFTVHKFIRTAVLFWVMVNIIRNRRDMQAVLAGLTAALIWQGIVVLWCKYVTGTVTNRAMGSFNHPNAMAMYLDLALPLLWACFLERQLGKRTTLLVLPAIALGAVSVIFTKSRAGMVLMPLTLAATTGLSIVMKPTRHKFVMAGVAMLAGSVLMCAALPLIVRRFQKAPKESAETREHFNNAARAMATDHLLGCGINQFSWALEHTDYYWCVYPEAVDLENTDDFRDSDHGKSRLGTAHHIYYLFMAETGYPGLALYILFLALIYMKTLSGLFRVRDPLARAIMCGMVCSFALLYVHGLLEWVWRQTQTIYLYFLLSGLVVAAIDRSSKRPGPVALFSSKLIMAVAELLGKPLRIGDAMCATRTGGRSQ